MAKEVTIPSRGFGRYAWHLLCTEQAFISEEERTVAAQVMPGNQTCHTESVVSPLGEGLAQKPSLP